MKKVTVLLFCLLLFLGISTSTFASHEIMQWRGNHAAAISLTFDDGYLSQFTNVLPLLDERNLKGTFFLITGDDWIPWQGVTWEQWEQAASQGHEIGSHSVTHPFLTQVTDEQLNQELSLSRDTINLNIPSQSCVSFAYPYGDLNGHVEAVASQYYIAARGIVTPEGGYLNHYANGDWPMMDFYNLACFVVDPSIPYASNSELHYYLYWAKQLNAWFVTLNHEVPNDKVDFYNQFYDDLLTQDFWIAPLGTAVRYVKEKVSSQLILVSQSSSQIKLNLTHSLDNSIYNEPLTIRSSVPASWPKVIVQQADDVYSVESIVEGSETVIYYDAVPNSGVITLTFVPVYTLTVNVMGSGSVTKNPDNAQYNSGDMVQLTAVPSTGWSFSGWSGDLTGSTNPTSITMNANKTVIATFVQAPVQYTLTVNITGSGSVVKNPDKAQYNSGDVVQLTAVPGTGWSFGGWSGDLTGSTNPQSITMNGNDTITATFVQTYSYVVTTSPSGLQFTVDGVIYTTPQTFNWGVRSTHTVSVSSPQKGGSGTRYAYSSWSDGGTQTHSITAPSSNTTYTASFDIQYTLTTSVTASGGMVSPSGTNWYNSGQVVSISAMANAGYSFLGWSRDLSGLINPTSITMTGPMSVRANFRKSPK